MATEEDCIKALQEAAQRLGESPTKAQYESLEITPSASMILRHCGGWNDAKEQAGLETSYSTGSRVQEQPDDVELPDGMVWEELSQDQRWHYKNRDRDRPYTAARKRQHRVWVRKQKEQRGCTECGLTDGVCLDFHHRPEAEKWLKVSLMVTYGYRKERLEEEIAKCEVLCANCHRRQHADNLAEIDWRETEAFAPGTVDDPLEGTLLPDQHEARRVWVSEYKETRGCTECGTGNAPCLSFHHPPGCEKTLSVSRLVNGRFSNEKVAAEINKCKIFCANCHRRYHLESADALAD